MFMYKKKSKKKKYIKSKILLIILLYLIIHLCMFYKNTSFAYLFIFSFFHLFIHSCPKGDESDYEFFFGPSIYKTIDPVVNEDNDFDEEKENEIVDEPEEIVEDHEEKVIDTSSDSIEKSNIEKSDIDKPKDEPTKLKDDLVKCIQLNNDIYNLPTQLRCRINDMENENIIFVEQKKKELVPEFGYFKVNKKALIYNTEVVNALADIVLNCRNNIKDQEYDLDYFIKTELNGQEFYISVKYKDSTWLFVFEHDRLSLQTDLCYTFSGSRFNNDDIIEDDKLIVFDDNKNSNKFSFYTAYKDVKEFEFRFILFFSKLLKFRSEDCMNGSKDVIFKTFKFKNKKSDFKGILISSNIKSYYYKNDKNNVRYEPFKVIECVPGDAK